MCNYYSFCQHPIIYLTVSAEAVPSILGHTITLSCPISSPSSDVPRSIKEWFRGPFFQPKATVAKLVTKGDDVEYNHTLDKKMGIDLLDGDLIITNLTLEDMGFYTCRFTGSKEHTFELYVRGLFYVFC